MTEIQIGAEMGLGAGGAVDLQQQVADQRADEHAHGEAGHADAGGQRYAAEDDESVVDHGRERGNHELALGILHGAEDAALVEAELRGKHQAGEENDAGLFLGAEARGDGVGQVAGRRSRRRSQGP